MGYKHIHLTAEQEEWFKENYPNTPNKEIMEHLSISMTTVYRLANRYGLERDPGFFMERERYCISCAHAGTRRMKEEDPERYERLMETRKKRLLQYTKPIYKGDSMLKRIGREKFDEAMEKARVTREAMREKDRRRVSLGLKPLTRMPLGHTSTIYIRKRRASLEARGYELRGKTAYYTSDTRRTRREKLYEQKYGYTFKEKEQDIKSSIPNWDDRQGGFNVN